MTQKIKVGVMLGSLRKGSYCAQLANALASVAPANLEFTVIEIGDMPHYNPDLETETPPESWTRFRKEVAAQDGVLFITPEYNRSLPSALKNAIDVGSRPWGQSIWAGKAGAVISQSPGALGGVMANHAVRQAMVFADVPLMSQPEMYIGAVQNLFNAEGDLATDENRAFLANYATALAAWLARFK